MADDTPTPSQTPLTVDQLRAAAARASGTTLPPKGSAPQFCPVCKHVTTPTLLIAENGNGPSVHCTNGCPDVAVQAILRHEHSRPEAASDPLAVVREELIKIDPARRRLAGLERVVAYGDAGDVIELHFPDGRTLDLGSAGQLMRQDHFKRCLAAAFVVAPRLKAEKYEAFTRALLDAAEHREGADTQADELRDWIHSYAHSSGRRLHLDTAEAKLEAIRALQNHTAITDTDGRIWLRIDSLGRWLRGNDFARLDSHQLGTRLARLGFTAQQLAARHGQDTAKVRCRVSPHGFADHADRVPTPPYTGRDKNTARGNSGNSGNTRIESGEPDAVSGNTAGTAGARAGSA